MLSPPLCHAEHFTERAKPVAGLKPTTTSLEPCALRTNLGGRMGSDISEDIYQPKAGKPKTRAAEWGVDPNRLRPRSRQLPRVADLLALA